MLDRARPRAERYRGRVDLQLADARTLPFSDATFDTTVTPFMPCSVPEPERVLREFFRRLKPGGCRLLFEHVRSQVGPIAFLQDLMTPLSRRLGPEMNRATIDKAKATGFWLLRDEKPYLHIVRAVEAVYP